MRLAALAPLVAFALLASAAAALAASGGAVTFTEVDHATTILPNQLNPCTGALDATYAFTGVALTHTTVKLVGGSAQDAHVVVHDVGAFTTTIAGTTYTGRVNSLSVVNVNRQSQNAVVQETVRATSAGGQAVSYRLLETVTFNAKNAAVPVSSVLRFARSGCA